MKPRSGCHPIEMSGARGRIQFHSTRRYNESAYARIDRSGAELPSKYSRHTMTPASSRAVSIVESSTVSKRRPLSRLRK
jgi:hypothetical protein